jgi:hypothetical protein
MHTQVHSSTCIHIQYSLKGIHVHQSAFKRVQYSGKGIHMHSGHIPACSNAVTLTQRHSCTLIFIHKSVSECVQFHSDSSKVIHAHSSMFNRIQCSPKGIHTHSEHFQPCSCSSTFNTCSKALTCTQSTFKCIQEHSVMITLTQRHSVGSDN